MSLSVQIHGVPQAIAAMQHLTPAVRIRWMRQALNAAMGVVKRSVVAQLRQHQDTGLLAKSQRVKVAIPASSKNPSVRDRPAWGLVGAGKGLAGIVTKRGKAKILTSKAKATAKSAGTKTKFASRYSHFPEKKHRDLAHAASSVGAQANQKFAAKIAQGIKTEAARLASKP